MDFQGDDKTPIFLHPEKRLELLAKGSELFNEEKFFEAHEVWEDLWNLETGASRTYLQALIQTAGHFVHLQKKNWSGAHSLATLALQKLAVPPANRLYRDLDQTPLVFALNYNSNLLRTASIGGEKAQADLDISLFIIPKLMPISNP